MNETHHTLIRILKTIFLSTQYLSDGAFDQLTSDDIEDWDSLNKLNMLIAIEEEFDLQIPDDEALMFNSFLYIEEYLRNV